MKREALQDAIVAHLRGAASPSSSRELARRFLKIDSADEETCRRLLAPLLERLPGVRHADGGWSAGAGRRPGAGDLSRPDPPGPGPALAPQSAPGPRPSPAPQSAAGPRPAGEAATSDDPDAVSLLDFIALACDGAGPAGSGAAKAVSLLPVVAGELCQEEHLPDSAFGDDPPIDGDPDAISGARQGLSREDLESMAETIGDLPVLCHRIGRELDPVLRACADAGLSLRSPRISASRLGHRLLGLKPNHTCFDLATALGVDTRGPDDCRGRVRMVAESFLRLVPLLREHGIDRLDLLVEFQEQPAAPVDLSRYDFDAEDLKALPAAPGVYVFLDRDRTVIYVGKAKNLRARVGSYFVPSAAGTAKGRAILDQVHALRVEPVASDLEAALVEAAWIAEHRPRLNRQFEVHERPAPYGPRLNLAVVMADASPSLPPAGACTIHFTREGRYVARVRGPAAGDLAARAWEDASGIVAAYFRTDDETTRRGAASGEIDWQLVASYVRRHRDQISVLDFDECGTPEEALSRLRVLIDAVSRGGRGRVLAR